MIGMVVVSRARNELRLVNRKELTQNSVASSARFMGTSPMETTMRSVPQLVLAAARGNKEERRSAMADLLSAPNPRSDKTQRELGRGLESVLERGYPAEFVHELKSSGGQPVLESMAVALGDLMESDSNVVRDNATRAAESLAPFLGELGTYSLTESAMRGLESDSESDRSRATRVLTKLHRNMDYETRNAVEMKIEMWGSEKDFAYFKGETSRVGMVIDMPMDQVVFTQLQA